MDIEIRDLMEQKLLEPFRNQLAAYALENEDLRYATFATIETAYGGLEGEPHPLRYYLSIYRRILRIVNDYEIDLSGEKRKMMIAIIDICADILSTDFDPKNEDPYSHFTGSVQLLEDQMVKVGILKPETPVPDSP